MINEDQSNAMVSAGIKFKSDHHQSIDTYTYMATVQSGKINYAYTV